MPIIEDGKEQIQIITDNLLCNAISSNWHKFIDTAVCSYNVDGIFTICLVMFLTAGFLFATICVTANVYQYFADPYWNSHWQTDMGLPIVHTTWFQLHGVDKDNDAVVEARPIGDAGK